MLSLKYFLMTWDLNISGFESKNWYYHLQDTSLLTSLIFFSLICLLRLGNRILEIPTFQMLWESWLASSFCCFYCTMGPTQGLYCSSNTVWGLWTKFPSPGFVSELGVFPKCLAVLYTPKSTQKQNFGLLVMRMTTPKGANARDNNVQEWAWYSHQEISHNALVLYI